MMIRQLIKRSIFFLPALMLAGCIPNPDLPPAHTAPAVTGPFDLYFPNAKKVFTGPVSVNAAESKARVEDKKNAIIPEKGEVKIGLLFPKTGSNEKLGKDFEAAAVLALYDAKLAFPGGYRLTLIPKDTAGSPSVAVARAKELKAEGADIFVGPLYSESTMAVMQNVQPSLLFSLSNNLDARSENGFIFGFTPESEMQRALTYALKKNRKRVAAILPNNEYGRKLAKVIRSTTPGFGASLDAVEFYVTTEMGRKTAVQRLAARIKPLNIDVICFGENKEQADEIIGYLNEQGVDISGAMKVGTSLWHNTKGEMPQSLVPNVYAASDDRVFNRFRKRFRSSNEREPHRLSALVYDAITMLAEFASLGNIPARPELMAAEVIQGAAGGALRFETDGSVTRALSVYQLESPTGYKVLENAPKSFK